MFESLPAPAIEYINSLEKQVDRLTEIVQKLQKMQFGQSSEKSKYVLDDPNQQSLFNEAEVCADEDAPEPIIVEKHERKPKRTKEELAKSLPVKEIVISLSENECVCDICEGGLKPIGRDFVRRELCFKSSKNRVKHRNPSPGCGYIAPGMSNIRRQSTYLNTNQTAPGKTQRRF